MSNKKQYSDSKDLIIAQLKQELYTYPNIDFSSLNNQLNGMELRYSALQEDLVALEREGRAQSEVDLQNIASLRQEVELLHEQLNRFRDQQPLREFIHLKQTDIDKYRAEVKYQQQLILEQQHQINVQEQKNAEYYEQLQKSQNDTLQIGKEIDAAFQKNRQLDNKIHDNDYELSKTDLQSQQQKRLLDNLQKELKHKNDIKNQQNQQEKIHSETNLLLLKQKEELTNKHKEQQLEHQQFEQLHATELDQQTQILEDYRALEQQSKLLDKQTESDLNYNDEESLKKLNLIEDSKFLNVEISRALDIINQLTNIKQDVLYTNIQLYTEIQTHEAEDKQIQEVLGKRQYKHDYENRIKASLQTISHFLS